MWIVMQRCKNMFCNVLRDVQLLSCFLQLLLAGSRWQSEDARTRKNSRSHISHARSQVKCWLCSTVAGHSKKRFATTFRGLQTNDAWWAEDEKMPRKSWRNRSFQVTACCQSSQLTLGWEPVFFALLRCAALLSFSGLGPPWVGEVVIDCYWICFSSPTLSFYIERWGRARESHKKPTLHQIGQCPRDPAKLLLASPMSLTRHCRVGSVFSKRTTDPPTNGSSRREAPALQRNVHQSCLLMLVVSCCIIPKWQRSQHRMGILLDSKAGLFVTSVHQ